MTTKNTTKQAAPVTTRQEVKQASQRKMMFVKGEKESLSKYNADGQALVKQALYDASLSQEQVYKYLSTAMIRGFNDFVSNYNTALLWFTLQEAINSPFGLDLFGKLEKAFYCVTGAGLSQTDKKGKSIFDKKESIISITKKETETGGFTVNIGLKKGFTRSDIGKAWTKTSKALAGNENAIAFLLAKYTGKPESQPKPKHEKTLADIIAELELLHDTTNDKQEQAKARAMLDAYKSKQA